MPLGPLPPIFGPPSGKADAPQEADREGQAQLDERGAPLRPVVDVVDALPTVRDVVKSPFYLGVHTLSPGDTVQVDHGGGGGSSLELSLAGEMLRDGGNTLCLHCCAVLPRAPTRASAPAAAATARRAPVSMDELLAGSGLPALSLSTAAPTGLTPVVGSGPAMGQEPRGNEEAQPRCAREAIMISGHLQHMAGGRLYPGPGGHLPDCFRTCHVGLYRVRIMRLETLGGATASPSPELSPKSTLAEPPMAGSGSGMRASMGSGLESLAAPSVMAHVAVDRAEALLDAGGADGVRCCHLAPGESCALWLTTQARALQQVSFGPPGDSFSVSLHTTPVAPPAESAPGPPLDYDPEMDTAQARGVEDEGRREGEREAAGEEEGRSFWSAELDMLRCGEAEGAAVLALRGAGSGAAMGGEATVVGDYRVEVTRQAAPTAAPLPGDSATATATMRCDYPMLLLHVQLTISRLTEWEAQQQQAACFDFLDAL
eukprot:jgi/Tetstr1/440439/TSEL_028772.t1